MQDWRLGGEGRAFDQVGELLLLMERRWSC
jgi:hypothetical protein